MKFLTQKITKEWRNSTRSEDWIFVGQGTSGFNMHTKLKTIGVKSVVYFLIFWHILISLKQIWVWWQVGLGWFNLI